LDKCFLTAFSVNPGHDEKFPFFIAVIHVDLTGLKHEACRYLSLDLTQFSPVLWLECVPEMQLLHLGLGSHEGFFSPFLQTGLE
jgi:hypothetical protein